jgi:hypothetical protein
MNLTGDPQGIEALHALKTTNKDYLRFLLQEARTVMERRVDFKAADGTKYRLEFVPEETKLVVTRLPGA